MRIYIADDHTLVREGIIKLLELTKDFFVVGSAETGGECLAKIAESDPDILLLDINLPDMSGLEVLKELKSRGMSVRVVMLTIHDDYAFLREAFDLGAEGYVLKDAEFEILKEAIHCVHRGEKYVQQELKALLVQPFQQNKSDDKSGLTAREYQILGYIASGYTNREIGSELGISEKTVKNHLFNIFKKIEVTGRTQAAIYAINNKLYTDQK